MNWTKHVREERPQPQPALKETWSAVRDGWVITVQMPEWYANGSVGLTHPEYGSFYAFPLVNGSIQLPSLGNVAEVLAEALESLKREGVDLRALCDQKKQEDLAL